MRRIMFFLNPNFWFLGLRLVAMRKSSEALSSNPFSGFYSQWEIEAAKKNREMNLKWFIRNFQLLKKHYNEEFDVTNMVFIAEMIGIKKFQLIDIDWRTNNTNK